MEMCIGSSICFYIDNKSDKSTSKHIHTGSTGFFFCRSCLAVRFAFPSSWSSHLYLYYLFLSVTRSVFHFLSLAFRPDEKTSTENRRVPLGTPYHIYIYMNFFKLTLDFCIIEILVSVRSVTNFESRNVIFILPCLLYSHFSVDITLLLRLTYSECVSDKPKY